MGSRNHDLRNKLQLAMLKLPKDYTSGDLMRCFADAAVEYMDEVAPEPKPYQVKTKPKHNEKYIVFYNDHGAVYGIPEAIVREDYLKRPVSMRVSVEPSEDDLEKYLIDWMSREDYTPHLILLQEAESFDQFIKEIERVENIHTMVLDENTYSS